jgi:ABC-type multidrug transport system fused ATPase/permease subunit
MNFFAEINFLFKKKEKIYFLFLILGLFAIVLIDVFSFSLIIPAFDLIILDKSPKFLSIDFSILESFSYFSENFKKKFIIIFISFFVIKNFLIIYFELVFLNFFKKINIRISVDLFKNYLNQDYILFLKNSSENILQKVTQDVEKFTLFCISLMHLLIDFLFLIGISILLIYVNVFFFLICLITFTFFILIYSSFFNKRIQAWSTTYRNAFGKSQNFVIEGIKAFKDLIIYNQKDIYINNFKKNRFLESHSSMRITFLSHVQKYWLETVGILVLLIILFYLINVNYSLLEVVPILTLFTAILFRLLTSLSRLIANFGLVKFHLASADTLVQEFKQYNNYKNELSFDRDFIFDSKIEAKNINFSYNSEKYSIFKNISFKVNKGDFVGILGPNGSGKTTLINLISGFLKPTQGNIVIDDKYELFKNRNIWFDQIACVQQNIFLWDTSIKNNIILSQISDDLVKFNYIKNLLNLDYYFSNFPEKLDTIIGADGIKISGGQKQLISIARALYKQAQVLIFDEPTASLDQDKMELIKNVVINLKGKKTIFMITHHKDYFYKYFDLVIDLNKQK